MAKKVSKQASVEVVANGPVACVEEATSGGHQAETAAQNTNGGPVAKTFDFLVVSSYKTRDNAQFNRQKKMKTAAKRQAKVIRDARAVSAQY